MTRLDRHVNTVRNKLALGTFLSSLGWALLAFAVVVWVNILVDRFLTWRLPRWGIWFFAGLGISPSSRIRAPGSPSIFGIADRSASVYGWFGPRKTVSESPTSMIRPRYMTAIRSARYRTTPRSCEISR